MQALMLAAGMGRRMGKYTQAMTKCMIEVGGRTLLERAVEALKEAGIRKFVMVVGWECEKLIEYIQTHITDMEFIFVYNYDYAVTNNIYSLYLAREYLMEDDTILLESDLVYDKDLIRRIVESPEENLVAVAKYEQWMDGTVATLTSEGTVKDFIEKKDFQYTDVDKYYKTVNIYKFSRQFSAREYLPFLGAYIESYGQNQYYETVLKAIAHISTARLQAYILKDITWYEIDDAQDLDIANTLFAKEEDKLLAYERHYGGYWRFPGLKDFCYLVNPYFPPAKMRDQMKYFYDPLLTQYPSGMNIQKLIAGKMLQLDEEYLLVGNGAAELINVLGRIIQGRAVISLPAFNEYIRCFRDCEMIGVSALETDFQPDFPRLLSFASKGDTLLLINPDNPSGGFVPKQEMLQFLEECRQKEVRCVVDESFVDFAEKELRYTLLKEEILTKYPNLVVIKSISKSYGVPGLRLGILATADQELLLQTKEYLPIWNINSFGEYFLQIYSLYGGQYLQACDSIAKERKWLSEELEKLPFLRVFPSQANYIMCQVREPYKSKELATQLLLEANLLIKDLSEKTGFQGGQYIRVAVKDREENEMLIEALREMRKL